MSLFSSQKKLSKGVLNLFLTIIGTFLTPPIAFAILFVYKDPSLMASGVLAGLCLIAGLSAYFAKESMSINGFGSKYYGKKVTDNGYIATKWLTILFIPILPVRSYEIYSSTLKYNMFLGIQNQESYSMQMQPLKWLYWPQVIK